MLSLILTKFVLFLSLCIGLSAAVECGKRKVTPRLDRFGNIEPGSYAGEWPWLVTLHAKMPNGLEEFICDATLINEWTLLAGK